MEVGTKQALLLPQSIFNHGHLFARRANVSSNGVNPTWMPFRSTLASEEKLPFSLRLMNGRFWVRVSSGAQHPGLAMLLLGGTAGAVITPVLLEHLGLGRVLVSTQGFVPIGVSLGGSSEEQAAAW